MRPIPEGRLFFSACPYGPNPHGPREWCSGKGALPEPTPQPPGIGPEVYFRSSGETGSTRLTHNEIGEFGLRWSPDGKLVSLSGSPDRVNPGECGLYIMRPSSGKITNIIEPREYSCTFTTEWSPSSKRFSFLNFYYDGPISLFTVLPNGNDAGCLTPNYWNDAQAAQSPQWSSRHRVLFHDGNSIVSVNALGNNRRRLVKHWSLDDFALSPTRRTIAYSATSQRRDFSSVEMYLIDPDGSDKRRLTENRRVESEPTWSPDGSRLAFTSVGFNHGGVARLMVLGRGGELKRYRIPRSTEPTYDPVWSPDGSRIAFMSRPHENRDKRKAWVISARTGKIRSIEVPKDITLHQDPYYDFVVVPPDLIWSPSGEYLAFEAYNDDYEFAGFAARPGGTAFRVTPFSQLTPGNLLLAWR